MEFLGKLQVCICTKASHKKVITIFRQVEKLLKQVKQIREFTNILGVRQNSFSLINSVRQKTPNFSELYQIIVIAHLKKK